MPYLIIFHPLADKEFYEAYQWYEDRLKGLGDRFEKAIEESLNQISLATLQYSKKKRGFREVKPEDFPYVIVYKVHEKRNCIYLFSISH